MDRVVLIVVVGLLAYVRSGSTISHHDALTGSETVWLKDLTTKFQTQKRIFGDHDLPDQLTFHVRRGSGTLTLKLKRNYEIDPNADIYFVQRNKEGRAILSKTLTSEREAVAYYQDMDNGAYMTVRCINTLNQQCERVISGNIQIGDRSYDLRLAGTNEAAGNFTVADSISRRYLLLDLTHFQQEHLVGNEDASNVNKSHDRWDHKPMFGPFTRDEKQNYYYLPDDTLSSRNLVVLQDRKTPDKGRQLKQNYYVKVAILIDSGVWDLYYSKVGDLYPSPYGEEVKRRIREAYSHIMNGVNLRYKTIEDPGISISVIPTHFIFFMNEEMFPHSRSKVTIENGTKYIDAKRYIGDLFDWDKKIGANHLPKFDHAMLFTTHTFHKVSTSNERINGISYMSGVCDPGKRASVVQARHYVSTVRTAAHELGHNLGAYHDGEGDAASCKSEDYFIMTYYTPHLDQSRTYIENMWTFSNCSVDSFKKTLRNRGCVKHTGAVFNKDEYTIFMKKQAGDVFTPQEQCSLIYGPGSEYFGIVSEDLCHLLRCKDPATGRNKRIYINAARGTQCGQNKWCIEGRCVLKRSK